MPLTSKRPHPHARTPARPAVALSILCLSGAMLAAGCGQGEPTASPQSRKARPAPAPASAPADDVKPTEAIGDYVGTLVKSKKQAETLVDKAAMSALGKDLVMYAVAHDGQFPPALADLGRRDLLHAPGPDGQEYQYVPGQQDSSPRTNVLAYETQPVHNGKVLALRVSGTVDLLAPADLEKALAQTRKKLK